MVNNVLDLEKTDGHMIEYKADRKARCISDRYGIINYMKELHIDNVIHVGCCGHPYYIEKRIKDNRWLQAKFESAFSGVIGTDINNEAVGLVKSVRSESKVYLLDMISDSEKIKEIINDGNANADVVGRVVVEAIVGSDKAENVVAEIDSATTAAAAEGKTTATVSTEDTTGNSVPAPAASDSGNGAAEEEKAVTFEG